MVIENLDWAEFLDRYDGEGALFYLDPPYWGSERDYGAAFDRGQFALMAARLQALKGRVILSLNDRPEVRETFAGFRIDQVEVTYMISQATAGAKPAGELIISNFDRPTLPLFSG